MKFFIVVYVDDFILVCNDQNKLLHIKEELNQKFEMKDLGELHFFLGMEVERNRDQRLLRINQITYLLEAEYMANTQATKEAIWITKLMMDLRCMEKKKVMVIRCDNQGAISLTKNPIHHARTKHIDVQHHFVQERVENGEVQFEYCPTEHMVADVLTKALSKERHHKLINMFGLETS